MVSALKELRQGGSRTSRWRFTRRTVNKASVSGITKHSVTSRRMMSDVGRGSKNGDRRYQSHLIDVVRESSTADS